MNGIFGLSCKSGGLTTTKVDHTLAWQAFRGADEGIAPPQRGSNPDGHRVIAVPTWRDCITNIAWNYWQRDRERRVASRS